MNDSEPEAEFQETVNKSKAMLKAVALAETFGVKRESLVDYGAVSAETARDMVDGAISSSRAQVAVAVTGIAGPEGGMPGKPVGTVWFAWKFPKKPIVSEVCHFTGNRAAVRQQTVAHALKQILHNLA